MQSFYGAAGAAKFRCPLEEFEGPRQTPGGSGRSPSKPRSVAETRAYSQTAGCSNGEMHVGTAQRYQPTRHLQAYSGVALRSAPAPADEWSEAAPSVEGVADDWSKPAPTVQDVACASATDVPSPVAASSSRAAGLNGKGPPDLRALSFKDWLLWLEPSGSLLRFEGVMRDNYDSVAQIVKTYMVAAKGERRVLDTQFFDDINATSEEDQAAFLRWFMRESGASGVPHTALPCSAQAPSAPQGNGSCDGDRQYAWQQQRTQAGVESVAVASGAASSRSNLDVRTCSFRDWLENVAAGSEMLQYLEALEDSFDTVAQIAKTYVVDCGGDKELDGQLFQDIDVSNPRHRQLFRAWFEANCGVRSAGDDSAVARGY